MLTQKKNSSQGSTVLSQYCQSQTPQANRFRAAVRNSEWHSQSSGPIFSFHLCCERSWIKNSGWAKRSNPQYLCYCWLYSQQAALVQSFTRFHYCILLKRQLLPCTFTMYQCTRGRGQERERCINGKAEERWMEKKRNNNNVSVSLGLIVLPLSVSPSLWDKARICPQTASAIGITKLSVGSGKLLSEGCSRCSEYGASDWTPEVPGRLRGFCRLRHHQTFGVTTDVSVLAQLSHSPPHFTTPRSGPPGSNAAAIYVASLRFPLLYLYRSFISYYLMK